jgi:hypothetical protein
MEDIIYHQCVALQPGKDLVLANMIKLSAERLLAITIRLALERHIYVGFLQTGRHLRVRCFRSLSPSGWR